MFIVKITSFINEVIIKEPLSCLKHALYRFKGLFQLPTKSGKRAGTKRVGKALLLLHGSGASPTSLIPLFNSFKDISPLAIRLIDFSKESAPVPTRPIHSAMREVRNELLSAGFDEVEFSFIGHSLGAIAAAKAIWVEGCEHLGKIHSLISLAGRLKFVSGPFDWFCETIVPEIEEIYCAYKKEPSRALLYTIAGELDLLVPLSSVHIAPNTSPQLTVKGVGHGGLPFAKEAHVQVRKWLKSWALES